MTDREIMAMAVKRFGGRQLVKRCEELSELTQAICKLFDGSVTYDMDLEAVVEEMAKTANLRVCRFAFGELPTAQIEDLRRGTVSWRSCWSRCA